MIDARIFVEKKSDFQVEANSLMHELNRNLHLSLTRVRLVNVYDIFNISPDLLARGASKVFSEPVTDMVYNTFDLHGLTYIAIEFLPGQFDQRADSAMQCLSLLDPLNKVTVRSAKIIVLEDAVHGISQQDLLKVKKYCINEVESREKDMSILDVSENATVQPVLFFENFINYSPDQLAHLREDMGLAMSNEDLLLVHDYFKNTEKRNPCETEIRMLDTYWSDHCRHTTFETELENITFPDDSFSAVLQEAFFEYLTSRKTVYKDKERPITLMDMATIRGKYERAKGNLEDLEVSEEINACSIYAQVDVDGKEETWLIMFKNETHNHPTEIEPFGGASTCIGGAIRDPLSGRSYVYQAMRVTGAGNITEPVSQTMEGKLPQQVISKTAAHGYSSYGNQIGLATTHVREIYHEGFKAKRMEIGAVVGAAPANAVRRAEPQPGDVVLLLGGRTGRDGIGGATGSSKEHTETSLEQCSSEVQKGNAPEERKLQRLFRNPNVTRLIKRANDFGAGGVSVAIGELADGLRVCLDAVPTKYKGLNGTELAISESQERMSVVIAPEDKDTFCYYCLQENIEATVIATVTDSNRLQMTWNGQMIVDISRDFIKTNGVRQKVNVSIAPAGTDILRAPRPQGQTLEEQTLHLLSDLNIASQKGMVEMFDSSIGATTLLMPYGGKYRLTETQVSAQKIPVRHGHTHTATLMSFGYNPFIFEKSPFHGAMYAVIESLSKIVAAGGNYQKVRFTFQEYFEKLGKDALRWGKPVAALLGAIHVQTGFRLPAIGGKDSMSGTFKDQHVPPTLVSFALTTANAKHIISPEFKKQGNYIYLIKHQIHHCQPDIEQLKQNFQLVQTKIEEKKIVSAFALQFGGIMEALCKMSFGNDLGFEIKTGEDLFDWGYGSIVVEATCPLDYPHAVLLGNVSSRFEVNGEHVDKTRALLTWRERFFSLYPDNTPLYPTPTEEGKTVSHNFSYEASDCYEKPISHARNKVPVKVLIPVFPGSNCDYDTARAFEEHGATTDIFVFRNINAQEINNSIEELAKKIQESHIVAFCGGFSSGDEPDGSGKFIANVLNNDKIKQAIETHLSQKRLILGICNGFQALVKSGLLPFAKIGEVYPDSPTLFRNDINRHVACMARTVVVTNQSPWLRSFTPGEVHHIALSHGEGKFVLSPELARTLFAREQVAFQYCDELGTPGTNAADNPNGSFHAIEGILSPDGLILGKMGHSERKDTYLYRNIPGNKIQDIFKNAVDYFNLQ
ncbi:MAG: phosphoribosylformylglycinamidine synthase [Bacteroidales bacterium]|jgi:phosphoribosylformylglycinamidine synthase|nr:phosphoribosylformylglycinamidine synthase [Bacteroidales bacterium]